jgi:hypothetical protein
MDTTTFDALARAGIRLRSLELGRQYVACPRCAAGARHLHNRRPRKLAVQLTPDGAALWFCNNCEWAGGVAPRSAKRTRAGSRSAG